MAAVNWTRIRGETLGARDSTRIPKQIVLPVLPRGLTLFMQKADSPNVSPGELAALIETDAALTCELLKFVNSARFGLRTKASSAQQALNLLGIRQTKLLLITAGAKLATAARQSKLINLRNFWNANLERALFAREMALLLKADPDLAFAAGMLQDFLLPALTNEQFAEYSHFVEQQARQPQELVRFEQNTFQWTHALAAGFLMSDWQFPDDLVCCVLFHHRGIELLCDPVLGKTSAAAVAVSSLVPDSLAQVPNGLEQLAKLSSHWPAFDLERIVHQVDEQFRTISNDSNPGFSLLHRLERSGLLAPAAS